MKNLKLIAILALPILVSIAAIIVLHYQKIADKQNFITGIAEVTEVDVAIKIPGRLSEVLVSQGDVVTKGEILARLESREIEAKVEQAKGAMEAAEARYNMAKNGARSEEKQAMEKLLNQATYQFELAEKSYARIQKMFKDSVISAQDKDKVEFEYRASKEQLAAAKAKYEMVMKGARIEEISGAEALYRQVKNSYLEACVYRDETTILSPIDGEVQTKIIDQGEMAAAGYPIITLIDPKDIWVTIQLREDQLTNIRKESKLSGIIPALGNKEVEFRVASIAPMADFATWKATNQKGDFDLKTFEIRLRPTAPVEGFRAGMTVRVGL